MADLLLLLESFWLRYRDSFSPPSPVFDFPPKRFMATAKVECASMEILPKDIAPVANRLTISVQGSTSSMSIELEISMNSSWPRKVQSRIEFISDARYFSYADVLPPTLVALCRFEMLSGSLMCFSPPVLQNSR